MRKAKGMRNHRRIPVPSGMPGFLKNEALYVGEAAENAVCEVHDWPFEKMRAQFIGELRARHGKGGLNACSECLLKFRADLDARRVARQ
jgi:hypothetical protein